MPSRPLLAALPLLAAGCGLTDALFGPDVPNPFEGDALAELTLKCQGSSKDAIAILDERLELLQLDHALAPEGEDRLRVSIERAAHPEALAEILTADMDLGFYAVAEDQAPLRPRHDPPEEAVLEALPTPGTRPDMAFDVEAMQALMALAGGPLPPVEGARIVDRHHEHEVYAAPKGADWSPWLDTLTLPRGTTTALECWESYEDAQELCAQVLLETPPPVTAQHVAAVEMVMDEQFYEPHLELRFDDAGREAFHQLSTRLVDRYLAIVSDGRVISMPMVAEPIPGGQAWLTMGTRDDQGLMELWGFYAMLQTGPLPAPCQVAP
jgi:preprotein translocase subunit SecD